MKKVIVLILMISILIGHTALDFSQSKTVQKIKLTGTVVSVETKIYNAINLVQKDLVLQNKEFKGKSPSDVINQVADCEEFFYYKGYTYTTSTADNRVVIAFKYTDTKANIVPMQIKKREQKQALNLAIKRVVESTILPDMNEYEKIKALHDYIVLNTAYDYENYVNKTIPSESANAYGVLVNQTAVCSGYAAAMYELCRACGIEAQVVSGKMNDGGEGHAWNIVRLDGKYYHLDATHDDPVPNVSGRVLHDYFLKTDQEMKNTRSWNDSEYPACVNGYDSY